MEDNAKWLREMANVSFHFEQRGQSTLETTEMLEECAREIDRLRSECERLEVLALDEYKDCVRCEVCRKVIASDGDGVTYGDEDGIYLCKDCSSGGDA